MYAQLKLFSEVIPEAQFRNKPPEPENYVFNIRENVTALSLAADMLFDHGVPHIREKSTLIALLEKADFLSKASGLISQFSVMNTSHGRLCNQLSTIVN